MTAFSKTILLVEDEALIALQEARLLQKEGYTVIQAYTGEEAVAVVKGTQSAIDLILMDINLGAGMDGAQAAQEILKEQDIPIVFLSAHTEPEVVEKTEKITSYGYVVKNTGATVLAASIKMAFKLHAAHQALRGANESLSLEIAERKQAEEKLRTSEANLKKAEKISRLGYWEWNILTNELNWSEGTYHIYALDPIKDKPTYDIVVQTVTPECRERFLSAVENAIKHDAPFEG